MAAGPLACFLHDYLKINKNIFSIEQGYSMTPSSPSCIEVTLTLTDGKIKSLSAGGIAVVSRFEEIEI